MPLRQPSIAQLVNELLDVHAHTRGPGSFDISRASSAAEAEHIARSAQRFADDVGQEGRLRRRLEERFLANGGRDIPAWVDHAIAAAVARDVPNKDARLDLKPLDGSRYARLGPNVYGFSTAVSYATMYEPSSELSRGRRRSRTQGDLRLRLRAALAVTGELSRAALFRDALDEASGRRTDTELFREALGEAGTATGDPEATSGYLLEPPSAEYRYLGRDRQEQRAALNAQFNVALRDAVLMYSAMDFVNQFRSTSQDAGVEAGVA